MSIPCQRMRAALIGVLCAAALMFPTWAAYAVEARTEAAAPEDDALFYGYLLQRAGVSKRVSLLSDAGSKLSDKDRELYDHLKAFVTKIASGEETETVYTIVYDDFPTTWTAAELGVSSIFSPEGKAALSEKVNECYNYNTGAVMDALLADCPYELYWYNKSGGGVKFSSYGSIAYTGSSTKVTITSPAPKFVVTMSVSPDYGSGTTVNRNLHAGIENTVANAKAVVDKYQDKSDYEKLLGYSMEICDLVTYDTAAAQNKNTPYGDPWQLISVFDGDPDTNVVCEGYSKAFKYLCDLSTFNSSNVECCLVTGLLGGGTGAGNHMWNVVTMDNGKRYLVDVTNSDSNKGPEYLLLKGGTPNSQQSTQYDFYGWLSFVYDWETRNLWGDEFLTLDTVDYKDAEPSPGGEEPDPGQEPDPGTQSPYAYDVLGITRRGANLTVKLQNNAGNGAPLMVAAYAESGQFLRVALDSTQTANIAQGTSGTVTVELDTGDAYTVKVIILDGDTQKPLCESNAYIFQ